MRHSVSKFIASLLLVILFLPNVILAATDNSILRGRIVLAVEQQGMAWYIEPVSGQRAYLGRPNDAFKVMSELGVGITTANLLRIASSTDSYDQVGDLNFAKTVAGRIFIQVEDQGKAWYVNPSDYKRYYLGAPEDAFKVMRNQSIGIKNIDLGKISILSNGNALASKSESRIATSSVMLSGKASWYGYEGGMFAASPDFLKGTVLKVSLLSNPAKSIEVVVNDFGPDRVAHPERVIDLDKVAFAALADLGAGIIDVKIEPVGSTSVRTVAAASQVSSASQSVKKDALGLTSRSAIVVSAKTGKVLYKKDENVQVPLASLTKIVAAKVFLNTKPDLNRVVAYKTQDENYNKQYASLGEIARLKVKNGETMQLRDYLYAGLIGSANNSIETLVRASGLKRETFIYRMNKYAKDVGAKNTHFVEPTGLSPENVTTASDYALISRYALQDGSIEKVTKTKSYTFSTINTKQKHYIKNTNKLISNDLNVTGSKTGYLEEAQYCLMTRAKDSAGRQVIAITFGTPVKTASFNETKKLINYGFSKL